MLVSSIGCSGGGSKSGNFPANSSSKQMTAFGFDEPASTGVIDETAKTIAIKVPYKTDITKLVAVFTTTGAKTTVGGAEQISETTENNFTGSVIYAVYAQDGSKAEYTVTVTVAQSDEKDITGFTIDKQLNSTISGKDITVVMPYGTDKKSLTPTITHTGASISPASGYSQDFTGSVNYTVTAADGSKKEYTVTVTVLLSSEKEITKFTILGVDGTINGTDITLSAPSGSDVTTLVPTIIYEGKSISPESGVSQDFTESVKYTVTAADDSKKEYTVTVTAEPSILYSGTYFSFTQDKAVTPLIPTITGGSVICNVSPSLPVGLSLDTSNGTISGTPVTAQKNTSYTITATNEYGSNSATINIMVYLPAVTGVTATAGDKEVVISWNPVTGASIYYVCYGTSPNFDDMLDIVDTTMTTSLIHQNLDSGVTYYYWVMAKVGGLFTDPYDAAAGATPYILPPDEYSLSSLSVSKGKMQPDFDWEATNYLVAPIPFSDGDEPNYYDTQSCQITAVAVDPGATLTIDGISTTSNNPVTINNLSVGPTTVEVVVTAADGVTVKKYSVEIYRALPVFKTGAGQISGYTLDSREDGATQIGTSWPSPRFSDNGNETVTDNMTGLVWLKNPGTSRYIWENCIPYCENLTTDVSDWRLPNVRELRSLGNFGVNELSVWLNEQGFSNVQCTDYWYWTSTSYAPYTSESWTVQMCAGVVDYFGKSTSELSIWPVRGESPCVAVTGQTAVYTANDDASYHKGVHFPSIRFRDNGDGTVTDNMTGLIWLKDANNASVTKRWSEALAYVENLNNGSENGNCGNTDWRLPNVNELETLINYGKRPYTWLIEQGFRNVKDSWYWTSTSGSFQLGSLAWNVNFYWGTVSLGIDKTSCIYVWPVRGPVR